MNTKKPKQMNAPFYVEGQESKYFDELVIFMDNYEINFHPEEGLGEHLTEGWDDNMTKESIDSINKTLYIINKSGHDPCGLWLKSLGKPFF